MNTTGDPNLTRVYHSMDFILSIKVKDHKGETLFFYGWCLRRNLSVLLLLIPVHELLNLVPV